MPQLLSSAIRNFRNEQQITLEDESFLESERAPFLTQEQAFVSSRQLEDGVYEDPSSAAADAAKLPTVTCTTLPAHTSSFDGVTPSPSKWRWTGRIPLLTLSSCRHRSGGRKEYTERTSSHKSHRPTPLRRVLRLLALALMLLGLLEFIILACGLVTSFFHDDVDDEFDAWTPKLSTEPGQWPTDFSADIHPVACHSHNDYWRKKPLFSALKAGCTGVEADVWLHNGDLYVGHSTSSLTSQRTLRSLYIDPLLKILEQQNPITSFHPAADSPRNGVFDTRPAQTLVLLIDFKKEGRAIWPYVVDQLEALRERKFLTYFNGSTVIEGPITVVVTGNAPFNMVVANPHYRDIFFDAPLDLMESLADTTPPIVPNDLTLDEVEVPRLDKRRTENQGQGRSGAAPSNPAIYSPANSYYASVSFKRSVGYPWRGSLSHAQKEKIQKQIAGAHARGLKVRYWGVPSWPQGMRNYLWRCLYRAGVDYLNVDDLRAATKGTWDWGKKSSWIHRVWPFSKM